MSNLLKKGPETEAAVGQVDFTNYDQPIYHRSSENVIREEDGKIFAHSLKFPHLGRALPPDQQPQAEGGETDPRAQAEKIVDEIYHGVYLTSSEAYQECVGRLEALFQQMTQAGYQEGLNNALGEVESLKTQAITTQSEASVYLSRLQMSIEQLNILNIQLVDKVRYDAVELAVKIAKSVIQQEVSIKPEILINLVRKLMPEVMGADKIILKLNPQDAVAVRTQRGSITDGFEGINEILIQDDPAVEQGGFSLETEGTAIDSTLENQLGNILTDLQQQQMEAQGEQPVEATQPPSGEDIDEFTV